jgi:predicted dehydrogenase
MIDGEVLVVGLGSIGERHVRNLVAAGHDSITVLRRHESKPRTLEGTEFRTLTNIDDAFDRNPSAVLVCLPNSMHIESLSRAVDLGATVLVEVPLAHQLDDLAQIEARQEDTGAKVLIGHNLRFHPALRAIKDCVDTGRIGQVLFSRAQFGEFLPANHEWEDYRMRYEARADLGGGAILTSIHEIDHAIWLFGPAIAVTCVARTRELDVEVEDIAMMIIEHESGALSEIELDFIQRTYTRSLQVSGSSGSVEWHLRDDRVRLCEAESGEWTDLFRFEEPYDLAAVINRTYVDELEHLGQVARGETAPCNDLKTGVHVLSVALAALRSSKEERRVELTP